jgi:predicted hydrocarbon binding protein
MSWKSERFRESLARAVGDARAKEFVDSLGREPKSLAAKARWLKAAMDRFDEEYPAKTTEAVMMRCGRQCTPEGWKAKAKAIYAESKDLKDFVARMNKAGIGGGTLKLEGKNKITGFYPRCYCGAVSGTKERFGPTYCLCSRGWLEELYGHATGKKVSARFKTTVIQGGERCEYEVTVG